MKRYFTIIFCLSVLYSCNNTNSNNSISVKDSTGATQKDSLNQNAQSLYTLADSFQTQHNDKVTLGSFAGKPTVVAMIFTNCGYACPRITSDMKNIADSLKGNRSNVNFVLVSFDTERDTVAQLQRFAKKMELDPKWVLLHGNDVSVRTLSVLLNVQFEKDADGNFSHSNIISVLDKNGALAFQKEGLEADQKETIEKINALIK